MSYIYRELVQGAGQGNRELMQELIDRLKPLILSAIRRYGRGMDREDLFQEACILVMEAVRQYDEGRGVHFLTFVKGRIYYGISNLTRRERAHISLSQFLGQDSNETLGDLLEDGQPGVAEQVLAGLEGEALYRALSKLTPKQRELIKMHFFEGMMLTDIARGRNVHYKTVLGIKARALKLLKSILIQG